MIPTLMIPGTLCDARVFDALVPLLQDHEMSIADITPFASVVDAADALLARAPDRFLCVGFSLGGFVALEMLRKAPHRLSGVVLIAGNAHPDRPELAARRREQAVDARMLGMEEYVAVNVTMWGLDALPIVASKVAAMATDLGSEVLARQSEMNITRPDLRNVAAASGIPLLVIAGADDPLCSHDRYATAAAGPNARLVVLPRRGHYLPLEAPSEVAAAMAGLALAA